MSWRIQTFNGLVEDKLWKGDLEVMNRNIKRKTGEGSVLWKPRTESIKNWLDHNEYGSQVRMSVVAKLEWIGEELGDEQMEITHIDNTYLMLLIILPLEKFCIEAEDGDRSLFTWRIWDKRRYVFNGRNLSILEISWELSIWGRRLTIYKRKEKVGITEK